MAGKNTAGNTSDTANELIKAAATEKGGATPAETANASGPQPKENPGTDANSNLSNTQGANAISGVETPGPITTPPVQDQPPIQQPLQDAPQQPPIDTRQYMEGFEKAIKDDVKERSTEQLQFIKTTVDAELQSRNIVEPISEEDAAANLEKQLVAQYGEGYVFAKQADGRETYFSKHAWANLIADKNGRKDGWQEQVKTPPEVQNLKK